MVAFAECEHVVPSCKSSIEDLDAAELSDYVRAFGLQKQIFYNVANDQGKPNIFVVSTAISDRIRDAKSQPLSVAEKESILESVDKLAGDDAFADINPVVMTDYATRRVFQELIRVEYPELRVFSWQEKRPNCDVNILGTIQA